MTPPGRAALSVDGDVCPLAGPHLSALDRGFTLGDGLFETIRVRGGYPIRLGRHLARLRAGAALLELPEFRTDLELGEIIGRTLAAGDLVEAVVRLTLSRGVPRARGLLPEPDATPTLVCHAAPFGGYPAELYRRGMRAVTSAFRRNEHSPLANVKPLGYLDNILARREAGRLGADEAMFLNTAGRFAGATAANLFVVRVGEIGTPPLADGALAGTVRAALLDGEFGGIAVCERQIPSDGLELANEAFLSNALMGIMPLTFVDGRPIGDGEPGPVTQRLRAAEAQCA